MMENILHQYPTINDCYYTKQLARINNLDIIQAKIDEKLDRKSQWQVAVYVKEKIVEAQTTCFGRGSNDLKKIPGNYYWGMLSNSGYTNYYMMSQKERCKKSLGYPDILRKEFIYS